MGEPGEFRARRRKLLRRFLIAFAMLAFFVLTYFSRQLLAPLFLAFIMSYLSKPLVYILRRKGYSSGLSVSLVAGALIGLVILTVGFALRSLPQGIEISETQIRAEHKLNQIIQNMLKVGTGAHVVSVTEPQMSPWQEHPDVDDRASANRGENSIASKTDSGDDHQPSWLYQKFHKEIDLIMAGLNSRIRISPDEERGLRDQYALGDSTRSAEYFKMLDENKRRQFWQPSEPVKIQVINGDELKAQLTQVMSSVSLWIFFPILFFFFLADDGSIFKYVMKFVPNHYFELTLTIVERVDRALGHYMRGTALECFMVGLVIGTGLFLFGVNFQSALLIGVLAGVTNAIPFLGTFVGIIAGAGHALVAEKIEPILPFIRPDDIFIGVLVAVGIAHLLDNAVFQPVFVGKAVNLHPLVVISAVAAGGVGFGFLGLLLAIPSVVISKTCLETLVRGLKEYRLI